MTVETDFSARTDAAAELPTLLFLYEVRSGPSRKMESLVAWTRVTQKKRLRVVAVDVEANPLVPRRLGVESFPALVLVKDGAVVGRHEGRARGRDIDALIRPHLADQR